MCISTVAHLKSDVTFSSRILDLHLGFIKFLSENIDSHTQVVPDIL